ncbi:MAG: serine/threonine protein kinase, partial [Chloroflexota bacterium]|nr:serine/threonine protein kinase [Chloroflexota bacterium]
MAESVTTTTHPGSLAGSPGGGGPINRVIVNGRYEVDLDDVLGSGGMAVVYRGRDLRTRRGVAMRTLRTEYRQDPALRARFRDETRLQAFAAHQNIARVFDFYQDRDACWAVHELVDGRSLRALLDGQGVFAPADVTNVLDQVADALADLHGRGVVHLDVNPRNVLVTPQGTVKLIDFGLAQTAGTVQEAIGGVTFGTAAYLSPEQAAGEPLGAAADIYALGCVVYELLTGSPPFSVEGDGLTKRDVIESHLHRSPRPVSVARPDLDLPESLDDVVGWALAKAPGDRYQGATAFARLFRAAVEDRTLSSSATTAPVAMIDAPPARPRTTVPGGFRRPAPVDPWPPAWDAQPDARVGVPAPPAPHDTGRAP